MKNSTREKINIKFLSLFLVLLFAVSCFTACNSNVASGTNKCDHQEGEWIVDLEATLDSTGKRHTECTLCGETVSTETIPKETCAHKNTVWITDAQATLDAEGSKHLECSNCGKNLKTEVIPELYLTQSEVTAKLSASSSGHLYIADDFTVGDFYLPPGGTIHLDGHVLTVANPAKRKSQSVLGTVDAGVGGEIVWPQRGAFLIFR